jgi:secondary thiamine-phosphate synthase enzyme
LPILPLIAYRGEMRQSTDEIIVSTRGKGFYEITGQVQGWLSDLDLTTGLLTVFIQHTSASLTIQENADPDVVRDLESFFSRLVPENDPLYTHTTEGPDDMPAHVRAALTQTHLSVPFLNQHLALGTWQGIYVFEHRRHPHRRHVVLHAIGE